MYIFEFLIKGAAGFAWWWILLIVLLILFLLILLLCLFLWCWGCFACCTKQGEDYKGRIIQKIYSFLSFFSSIQFFGFQSVCYTHTYIIFFLVFNIIFIDFTEYVSLADLFNGTCVILVDILNVTVDETERSKGLNPVKELREKGAIDYNSYVPSMLIIMIRQIV